MDAGLPAALVGAPCRVLILFAQNRKGVPKCRKNRMAFDAGRQQENLRRKPAQKNPGYYRPWRLCLAKCNFVDPEAM